MEHLDGIVKLAENEFAAIVQNGKFRSREEIDSVYKLMDIVKDRMKIECMEQELDERRREINKTRQPMPLSYAYGYCRSDDRSLKLKDGSRMSVNEVYRLADERMYVNKVAMKRNTVSDEK